MCRIFLQEIFVVYDCLTYDIGTTTNHNDLFTPMTGFVRGTTNTTINRSEQCYTDLIPINDGVIFEFDLDEVNYGRLQVARYETGKPNSYHYISLSGNGTGHYRVESLPDTLVFKKNGNTISSINNPPKTNSRLFFITNTSNQLNLKYRNFKVYSI